MTAAPATDGKPIRLVIADVDGTLVTHDKVLTKRAAESVFKLRDAGTQFAVTSGRPPHGMAMLIDPLKLDEPLAAFNGGVVIQPDLKTVLRQNFLSPSAVKQAVQLIIEHKLDAWIYTDLVWYVRDLKAPHVDREEWTVKFAPVVTKDLESLMDRVAKVVGVSDDLNAVQRCEKDVQDACGATVSAARSQPYYLDQGQQRRGGSGDVRFAENSRGRDSHHRRYAERRANVCEKRRKHSHGKRKPGSAKVRNLRHRFQRRRRLRERHGAIHPQAPRGEHVECPTYAETFRRE